MMDLFVARQPIFDLANEIYGYELLYRRTARAGGADPSGDPDRMSSDVIIQSFLEMGLERLTSGRPGFVNFGREMLLSRVHEALDPETVVIELLEDVESDAEVRAVCAELVRAGYRLALDDFVAGGSQDTLLPLASIVKVDVLAWTPAELAALAERLRPSGVALLAERVETAETHAAARELGFTLFQGYYFSRPEMVAHAGSAVDTLGLLPLLNLVQDESITSAEIESRIRRDPSLAYKLLRIVNSAASGGRGIDSILHAINLIGRHALFRWLSLLLTSSLATGTATSRELVTATLTRARLLELLAAQTRANAGALFLTGMFSRMDALLQMPMAELVERVHFAPEVRSGLLREPASAYLPWLELAEAYESAGWQSVVRTAEGVGVDPGSIGERYLEAFRWSCDLLSVLAESPGKPAARAG